jgi:hypothetical protein
MADTRDPATRERDALRIYGCTFAEVVALNDGKPLRQSGTRANSYAQQRKSAAERGVPWELTFREWWQIWSESGRWQERGVGRNGYCMARHGDVGPYKVGNVSIQSSLQNSRDGVKKTHASLNANPSVMSACQVGTGRGWTYRPWAKTPYQVVFCRRYIGCFMTQQEAEDAYRAAVEVHRAAHMGSDADFFCSKTKP